MNESPFCLGKPALGKDFYNRGEEIEEALNLIGNVHNFSIVGEEGIGKTSFLKQMMSGELLERHGIDLGQYNYLCTGCPIICQSSSERG